MNILTTYCALVANEPRSFDIHWRHGQRSETLRVNVQNDLPDPHIVAELSALHWLLGQRSIFGETQTGKGLVLTVSAGAIRKVGRASVASDPAGTGKPHLLPYGHFLAARFAGAEIVVSHDTTWLKTPNGTPGETLTIRQPLRSLLTVPAVGPVEVSAHALDRFGQRLCQLEPSERWRLLRRIATGARQRVEPPINHAPAANRPGELWVNPDLRWGFVLVRQKTRPVMVTAYAV